MLKTLITELIMLFLKKKLACITIFIFLTGLIAPPGAESISTKEEEKLAKEFLVAVKKHYKTRPCHPYWYPCSRRVNPLYS